VEGAVRSQPGTGTDVMNFAKKLAKILAFLTQNKAKLCKNLLWHWFLRKTANFVQKIGKNRRKL
jgi:hypothetical protein